MEPFISAWMILSGRIRLLSGRFRTEHVELGPGRNPGSHGAKCQNALGGGLERVGGNRRCPEGALSSPHLEKSFDLYRKGFVEDRNHFYSGLNALAMSTIMTELARPLNRRSGRMISIPRMRLPCNFAS